MIEKVLKEIKETGWSFNTDFLSGTELQTINAFFVSHKNDFIPAKVGKGSVSLRATEIRGDNTLWLDPLAPQPPFEKIMNFLEELRQSLNQNLFLGLKEFECHLAFYPVGSFYIEHLDRFESDSSRTLSFVFYIHDTWNSDDGGELVLYSKDKKVITSILPLPGSVMCFMSEDFPHEVKVSRKERRTLTGWMHTKIIY
jgi:SM-20-related protein